MVLRKSKQYRATPGIEALEDRELLAGNVIAGPIIKLDKPAIAVVAQASTSTHQPGVVVQASKHAPATTGAATGARDLSPQQNALASKVTAPQLAGKPAGQYGQTGQSGDPMKDLKAMQEAHLAAVTGRTSSSSTDPRFAEMQAARDALFTSMYGGAPQTGAGTAIANGQLPTTANDRVAAAGGHNPFPPSLSGNLQMPGSAGSHGTGLIGQEKQEGENFTAREKVTAAQGGLAALSGLLAALKGAGDTVKAARLTGTAVGALPAGGYLAAAAASGLAIGTAINVLTDGEWGEGLVEAAMGTPEEDYAREQQGTFLERLDKGLTDAKYNAPWTQPATSGSADNQTGGQSGEQETDEAPKQEESKPSAGIPKDPNKGGLPANLMHPEKLLPGQSQAENALKQLKGTGPVTRNQGSVNPGSGAADGGAPVGPALSPLSGQAAKNFLIGQPAPNQGGGTGASGGGYKDPNAGRIDPARDQAGKPQGTGPYQQTAAESNGLNAAGAAAHLAPTKAIGTTTGGAKK